MKTKAIALIMLLFYTLQLMQAKVNRETEMIRLLMEIGVARDNLYNELDSLASTYSTPEARSDFETEDEYIERLKNQYYGRQITRFAPIINHSRTHLDSLIEIRHNLLRQQYPRTDVVLEKGRYDIDRHVWPMTVRYSDSSKAPINFNLDLDRDKAMALNQAWDNKEICLIEQFDIVHPLLIPTALTIYNPATGDSIRHQFDVYRELPEYSGLYEFSPDGRYLVMNEGGEVVALDLINGERISLYFDWEDGPRQFTFCSKSGNLAVLTYYYILIYNASLTERIQRLAQNVIRDMRSISWSPDSRFILAASDRYATMALFSIEPAMRLWAYRGNQESNFGALGFSPNGRVVRTNIGINNKLTVEQDMLRGSVHLVYPYPEMIKLSRQSDDYKLVASVDDNNKLYIVRLDTGNLLFTQEFDEEINDIEFSVESRFLSIRTASEIQIIKLSDYSIHHRFSPRGTGDFSLSPDGGLLAVDHNIYRIK